MSAAPRPTFAVVPRVADAGDLARALAAGGVAVVPGVSRPAFEALAASLGPILQRERVALRAGAHAYLARPGPVPLHTDHADVAVVAWWCEAADTVDGASCLLDAAPVLDALPEALRTRLRGVHLACPLLAPDAVAPPRAEAGGPAGRPAPPMQPRPVLVARPGRRDALFCSPWLRPFGGRPEDESGDAEALEALRGRLRAAIARDRLRVPLAPGEALFVDNRRILHGRDAIAEDSPRCLHRRWIGAA